MLITDRQSSVSLSFIQKAYSFSYDQKVHNFSSLDEVHEFFRDHTNLDSIKFTCDGQKHYAHFFDKEVEIYSTKKALRRTLSQEGGGAWVEEKGGKKRYFVEEKGWISTSYREVEAKDCVEPTSTWQKVLGLGLGMLAIAPGVSEFLRHVPITKEAAIGALAFQQRSPLNGLLICTLFSSARAQSEGVEFQISASTQHSQSFPSVAALSDGGFVSVWWNSRSGNAAITGQRYDLNGTQVGTEFVVSAMYVDINTQAHSDVVGLNDGGFVVTWEYGSVYAKRYDSEGSNIGSEFQVSTNLYSGDKINPSITVLDDGGFAIVWDNGINEILGRRFDGNGDAVGNEFSGFNAATGGTSANPRVSKLENGEFVIVYSAIPGGDQLGGIYGQRHSSDASLIGSMFHINTYTTEVQNFPDVSKLTNETFVVVWTSNGQDGSQTGIYGQKYFVNNTQIGSEFQINNYTAGAQNRPRVAGFEDGSFVVVWVSMNQDGNLNGIFGQRYDRHGIKEGDEFQVNDYIASHQSHPDIAALGDGGFVVVWQNQGQSNIVGKRYAPEVLFSSSSSFNPTEVSSASFSSSTNSSIQEASIVLSSSLSETTNTSILLTNSSSDISESLLQNSSSTQVAPSTNPSIPSPSSSSNAPVEESSRPGGGFPGWGIAATVGAGVLFCIGSVAALFGLKKRRNKEPNDIELQRYPRQGYGYQPRKKSSHKPIQVDPLRRVQGRDKIIGDNGQYYLIENPTEDEINQVAFATGYQYQNGQGKIGQGAFGTISLAQKKGTGEFLAVKAIVGQKAIEESENEAEIQEKLDGQSHIMQILDRIETQTEQGEPAHYLIMSLAGFGNGRDLTQALSAQKGALKERILSDVAEGLLLALDNAHKKDVYHLDLWPGNVVFGMDGESYLIDFGHAEIIPNGEINHQLYGRLEYQSPEAVKYNCNKKKSKKKQEALQRMDAEKQDAWSLGVTLLEIATGINSFDDGKSLKSKAKASYFENKLANIEELEKPKSGSVFDIINGLLAVKPRKRLGIQEALNKLEISDPYEVENGQKVERWRDFVILKNLEIVEMKKKKTRKSSL